MIRFSSWHRRGLAAALTEPDTTEITAWVKIDGVTEPITHTIRLAGPALVAGIASNAFGHRDPGEGASGIPANQLAYVELQSPDLPWRYTPSGPGSDGQLQPWIALIVVEEGDGVELIRDGDRVRLKLDATAVEQQLPSLSPLWAHVQLDDDVPTVSRLVCPRRLPARRRLRACVVPAFEAGRMAGLGIPTAADAGAALAWDVAVPVATELPVFATWTFETGDAEDFEVLCRRLQAADAATVLQPRTVVVDDDAINTKTGDREFALQGAMIPADTRPRSGAGARLVEEIARVVSGTEDPLLVGPPRYGAFAAGDAAPWRTEIDADPAHRAAAGIGAEVVRANDEAWMQALWARAGELRTYRERVERARLALRTAGRWQLRAKHLDDGEVMHFSSPLLPYEKLDGVDVTTAMKRADIPAGTIGRAVLRVLRPGGRIQKTQRVKGSLATLTTGLVSRSTLAPSKQLHIASLPLAAGAYIDSSWIDAASERSATSRDPVVIERRKLLVIPQRSPFTPAKTPKMTGVSRLPELARVALGASSAVQSRLRAQLVRDGGVPHDVMQRAQVVPRINEALAVAIHRLSPDLLAPGLSGLEQDRVMLLESNPAFVAAALLGANRELGREILWREFPAPTDATTLYRFWSADADDIKAIDLWRTSTLAQAGAAVRSPLLLVIRSELFRRYPDVTIRLVKAQIAGGARTPSSHVEDPVFATQLGPDTKVFGFVATQLDATSIKGARTAARPGWYAAFEAGSTRLQFGLEPGDSVYGSAPPKWDDLAWSHLYATEAAFSRESHLPDKLPLGFGAQPSGARWGRGASDQARILARRPFRLYLHGEVLLGGSDA